MSADRLQIDFSFENNPAYKGLISDVTQLSKALGNKFYVLLENRGSPYLIIQYETPLTTKFKKIGSDITEPEIKSLAADLNVSTQLNFTAGKSYLAAEFSAVTPKAASDILASVKGAARRISASVKSYERDLIEIFKSSSGSYVDAMGTSTGNAAGATR